MSSIDHITNPADRIRFLVQDGRQADAFECLLEVVKAGRPYFYWYGGKPDNDQHKYDSELFTTGYDPEKYLSVNGVKLSVLPSGSVVNADVYEPPILSADLLGLRKELRMTRTQQDKLIRLVIYRMVDYPTDNCRATKMADALQRVVRNLLSKRDHDARMAERWMILQRVRGGRVAELRRTALPKPVPNDHACGSFSDPKLIRRELDPIVDRMRELGFTDEEIRKELLDQLEKWGKGGGRWEYILAWAGAKCFEKDDAQLRAVLQSDVFPVFIKQRELSLANWLLGFFPDGRNWGCCNEPRSLLIKTLANGNAGAVYHWFFNHNNEETSTSTMLRMRNLVEEAFHVAMNDSRYGIAAALGQQFRGILPLEAVDAALDLARRDRKPVVLDWVTSFTWVLRRGA